MILSVHAIFGAAVASLVPNHPVFGFGFGFVSHFVLDAIPHKDYKLISLEADANNKPKLINNIYRKFSLARDIILVSVDALIGFILAFLLFFNPDYPIIFFLGAFGSLLPDFLTFLYLIIRHKSLQLFFNFHVMTVHSKFILKLNQITGVTFQFFTIGILISILFFGLGVF
jgi:hypothetical protein